MRPQRSDILRALGSLFLCTGVLLAIITLRLTSDGRRGLDRAAAAMEKGDRDEAVIALEDAAKAYVPGARHVPRALRDLSVLARAAEMRGEEKRALNIWKVIRRAVLATRNVVQPNNDTLVEAEKAIVRLYQGEGSKSLLIRRPEDPSPMLSVLLVLGLCAWITGSALWVLRPGEKGAPWVSTRVSVVLCLGGLAVWLLCAWLV